MANYGNLHEIYRESLADRATAPGDTLESIQLRDKVIVAMWKEAASYLDGTGLPAFPPEPPAEAPEEDIEAWRQASNLINTRRNELIGWAQQTIAGDGLKLLLATAPANQTKDAIQAQTDADVSAAMEPLIPLLAKGKQPGQ